MIEDIIIFANNDIQIDKKSFNVLLSEIHRENYKSFIQELLIKKIKKSQVAQKYFLFSIYDKASKKF